MAIAGVDPKCYILALFVRDDGARFLLGDDPYEFKDKQLHFQQNTIGNDVVEVQGNDGYLLAGQVRRPGTQSFDGYVANGTDSKTKTEEKRRAFLQFFRRSHFYKVIYVFPNGTAIQRKQGFLVDDPTVQELYQQYPEYHVALNFEDVNYYTYEEDDEGHEIYAEEAIIRLVGGGATGGLIWDNNGVVWEEPWSEAAAVSGTDFQVDNLLPVRTPISDVELRGDTYQQTYSGKNLAKFAPANSSSQVFNGLTSVVSDNGSKLTISGTATTSSPTITARPVRNLPAGTYTFSIQNTLSYALRFSYTYVSESVRHAVSIDSGAKAVTFTLTEDLKEYDLWLSMPSGTSVNLTIETQLELGSTATDYEPYVGGIPSPNPDYPQTVQTVTGEQTVRVTGKNLLPNLNTTRTYLGVTYTHNEDGSITVNGTSTGNSVHPVNANSNTATRNIILKAGNYCLNGFSTDGVYFQGYLEQGDAASTYPITTFTVGSDGAEYGAYIRVPEGVSVNNLTIYPQLEIGTTSTEFEPYQEQSYYLNFGEKNLFNSAIEQGSIAGATGADSSSSSRVRTVGFITAQPQTNYTVSAFAGSALGRAIVFCYEEDGTYIDRTTTTFQLCPYTFTTLANTAKIRLAFTRDPQGDLTPSDLSKVQLEEGSSLGPYAPYTTQVVELCKIGTYQDYIHKSGDDWYVHKEIGKDVMPTSGYTLWSTHTDACIFYRNYEIPNALFQNGSTALMCNSFVCKAQIQNITEYYNNYRNDGYGFTLKTQTHGIAMQNIDHTTITDFHTWISNNPITLYYALATPTDTKITDADLVAQLDALGALRLFVGENNILVGATSPNLPATLQFDYYTKYAALGAEWEEGGTKGPTLVDVDAIDNTYPVWELTGPAVNPTLSVLTTNTALTYNGTITASQTLVIDMFNKTATLNGTSVIGNISGDWVYMAPGTNRVAYTTGNPDAPDSKISWQEVVG